MAGLMALYSICSTVVYFEQARIVGDAVHDPAARTALFAQIDLAVNLLSAATQAFGTGWLLTGAGVGTGLALLPALTSVGLVALALWPTVGMIAAVQIVRRSVHYAVERPAREVCTRWCRRRTSTRPKDSWTRSSTAAPMPWVAG
jgi:AAA family ATP:ADP antiporter